MKVFSEVATIAKNSLSNDGAFLTFLQIDYPGLEMIRLVRNTEDVTWRNETWTRFPMSIEASSEDGKTIPSLTVKISNCTGIIQTYLHKYNGLTDAEVKIFVAYSKNLTVDDAEFELDYTISSTKYDETWVSFTLGASTELINRFPTSKYLHDFCPFVCGDIKCGYTGSEKCVNNLATCKIPQRFGGCAGMTT